MKLIRRLLSTNRLNIANRNYIFRIASMVAWVLASTGCDGVDTVLTPPIESTTLYSRLDVNHHAVLLSTVSPYDTVRLHTTPRSQNGEAWKPGGISATAFDSLLAASPVIYVSQDSAKVKVTADGLVRAIAPTSGVATVRIIASRQIGNVTRADTILVRAQNMVNPPRIHVYRHRPIDTLKVAKGANLALHLTSVDTNNNSIANVVTYVKSIDSTVVAVGVSRRTQHNATFLRGRGIEGSTRIISQAYVYGISVADTFVVIAGAPLSKVMTVQLVDPKVNAAGGVFFNGFSKWVIGPGGAMGWSISGDSTYWPVLPINVVFDDSTIALAADPLGIEFGNIRNIQRNENSETRLQRRFLRSGEYFFTVEPFGLRGSVVVAPQ